MEYRQIHARIRETSELLNTSNAKEQLADSKGGKEREKRIRRPCDFGLRLRFDFARKFDISQSYISLVSVDISSLVEISRIRTERKCKRKMYFDFRQRFQSRIYQDAFPYRIQIGTIIYNITRKKFLRWLVLAK